MSETIIKRLRGAVARASGITVELPKAFITEVIEAMETASPVVDLDALVRKQREWNEQVIAAYLQAGDQKRLHPGPKPGSCATKCGECGAAMLVLAKRSNGRRMMCVGCKRRVTVNTGPQPGEA